MNKPTRKPNKKGQGLKKVTGSLGSRNQQNITTRLPLSFSTPTHTHEKKLKVLKRASNLITRKNCSRDRDTSTPSRNCVLWVSLWTGNDGMLVPRCDSYYSSPELEGKIEDTCLAADVWAKRSSVRYMGQKVDRGVRQCLGVQTRTHQKTLNRNLRASRTYGNFDAESMFWLFPRTATTQAVLYGTFQLGCLRFDAFKVGWFSLFN